MPRTAADALGKHQSDEEPQRSPCQRGCCAPVKRQQKVEGTCRVKVTSFNPENYGTLTAHRQKTSYHINTEGPKVWPCRGSTWLVLCLVCYGIGLRRSKLEKIVHVSMYMWVSLQAGRLIVLSFCSDTHLHTLSGLSISSQRICECICAHLYKSIVITLHV